MRFTLATILATAGLASAHATVYGVWVNGVDQGDGRSKYIRSPTSNSPVKDLTSANIVCNDKGATKVDSFVSAAAGDKVTFEWYHDNRGDDIIAASHKGPIITYIAEYTEGAGTGAIWTKIAEEGYDGSSWAVDKLISNKGKKEITIPSALAAGKYLLRQEIIAHHESDTAYNVNSARGAQFYPSCVQLELTSGGSSTPDQKFDFNTGYTYSDPGILFNLYGSFTSYTIPGPEVWTGGSGGSSPSSSAAASPTSAAATSAATSAAATSAAASTSAAAQPTTSAAVQPTQTATPSFTSIRTSASARPTNGGGNNGSRTSSAAAAPTSTKAPSNCAKKRSIRGGARPQL